MSNSAGLVCFCYYTVDAWISNTVLILTILCNFGLAISFAWFMAERWAYRQHQGTETAMGALIGWALKFQAQSHFITNIDMKQVGRRMVDVLKSIAGALATCLGWCLRFCRPCNRGIRSKRRRRNDAMSSYGVEDLTWSIPDRVYGLRPARIPVRTGVAGAAPTPIRPVTPVSVTVFSPFVYAGSIQPMTLAQESTDPKGTAQPFVTEIPETQSGYRRGPSQFAALDRGIPQSHAGLSPATQADPFLGHYAVPPLLGSAPPLLSAENLPLLEEPSARGAAPTPMLSPNYYTTSTQSMTPTPMLSPNDYASHIQSQSRTLAQGGTDPKGTSQPFVKEIPETQPGYSRDSSQFAAPDRGIPFSHARSSRATQADPLPEHYLVYGSSTSARPLLSTEKSPLLEELGNARVDEGANVYEDSDTGVSIGVIREHTLGSPSIPRQPNPTTTRIDTLALALKKMAAVQTSQGHSTAIKCVELPFPSLF